MQLRMFGGLAALVLLTAGNAAAATQHFGAKLTGANEVPANESAGAGEVKATFDTETKVLSYTATYSGLSGPATMAHFHGPAAPGANGPVALPVIDPANPIAGTATLSDAQAADLAAGKWYFNVHTAAHPPGEIRGQVTPQP